MAITNSKQKKEIEKRIQVKKTIKHMQIQINKLEEQKKMFIAKAIEAKKKGISYAYDQAKNGIKLTLSQQKRAQELLLSFEITSQIRDVTEMTQEFLKGLSILSKDMLKLTNSRDFAKVQNQFEMAMSSVEKRNEEIEMHLDSSEMEFNSLATDGQLVSDTEIDKLIEEQTAQEIDGEEISVDDLDAELDSINKKINPDK